MAQKNTPPQPKTKAWLAGLAGLAGAVVLILVFWPSWAGGNSKTQPVLFNHQFHTQDMGLECSFCHQHVESAPYAGKPEIDICAGCHLDMVTKKPEAQKIIAFARAGKTPPWVRLTRLAPHVRFSHVRHVVAGKVECAACHGEIAHTTTPPTAPLITLDMNFCIGCHQSSAFALAPEAASKGADYGLDGDGAEKLAALAGKRFWSEQAFFQTLDSLGAAPLGGDAKQRLKAATHPLPKVTMDCLACHR
ncbi:MAG: cytochrome c family protein [Deltaproteobacteria bacterium]|nr:cytochrome c family protein [Deltaproteobacteria bacterium]